MTACAGPAAEPDWEAQRRQLVSRIEAEASRAGEALPDRRFDPAVLQAIGKVPRHLFVPEPQRRHAYENRPLPIGQGQTISQPFVVALMSDLADVEPGETVLEVGTGSGYQAAVLAEMGASVHTIEIVPELAAAARETLARLGYEAVAVHVGDGSRGVPGAAPFDAIVVTAAAEEVPGPLLEQLAPQGRLVMPVGPPGRVQNLVLMIKGSDGRMEERRLLPVRFVPLTGALAPGPLDGPGRTPPGNGP